jgi:hypothetical protein
MTTHLLLNTHGGFCNDRYDVWTKDWMVSGSGWWFKRILFLIDPQAGLFHFAFSDTILRDISEYLQRSTYKNLHFLCIYITALAKCMQDY